MVVIGATSWGTTLAVLFARNGAGTSLLVRNAEEAGTIIAAQENHRRRPGLKLPPQLLVTAGPDVLVSANLAVLAVPAASLTANLHAAAPHLGQDASVLSASKGIRPQGGERMSELIVAAGIDASRVLVLSGPNFAGEIAAGLPAASVIAGQDAGRVQAAQSLLNSANFRVYSSADVAGVELGGALKNVIAIACGLSDGLGFGENAKAALITRGLAEIIRLGVALGAQQQTFQGLAGLGDLVLTCQSNLSRNRRLGLALAEGKTLPEALASIDGVVEGVETARAVRVLAGKAGIEMPICSALYEVLFEQMRPQAAVQQLMARDPRPELD